MTVGNIEVHVEAPGFAPQAHSPFSLAVNQVATIDFHLSVGAASATVEVSTAPPLLQSDSTEISTLLDANAVSNLPLASRDSTS